MSAPDPSATPWPWYGCTLAEARQRTADRDLWKEYLLRLRRYQQAGISGGSDEAREQLSHRHQLYLEMQVPKKSINRAFHLHLCCGRLSATGRSRDMTQALQIVAKKAWLSLSRINYGESSAHERWKDGGGFVDVRVHPVLDSISAIDMIDGKSFAEVFRKFVLGDPEVVALAKEAIKVFPEAIEIFSKGCRGGGGSSAEWSVTTSDPTGYANLSKAARQEHSIPDELAFAVKALSHRWDCLVGPLQRGTWVASGFSQKTGGTIDLLPSIWIHPDIYLNPMAADLLEIQRRHAGLPTGYRKHAMALMLRRASVPDPTFDAQQTVGSAWRRSKMDEVRAALRRADIDPLVTPLTSKEIEERISHDLPFSLHSEAGFAKMLGRIRKQARSIGQ